jgi:hypothetical protein
LQKALVARLGAAARGGPSGRKRVALLHQRTGASEPSGVTIVVALPERGESFLGWKGDVERVGGGIYGRGQRENRSEQGGDRRHCAVLSVESESRKVLGGIGPSRPETI